MKWRRKRQPVISIAEAARDVEAARADRIKSEEALADTNRRAEEEHRNVIMPLREARRNMLEHNHVFDDVVRHLRGSQP